MPNSSSPGWHRSAPKRGLQNLAVEAVMANSFPPPVQSEGHCRPAAQPAMACRHRKPPCHDRLMSRVFSREEFYQLVWVKPMTHLAKEFVLSDVALHKICRKHRIPNPPLGWAKKAVGKKVSRTPLPQTTKASPAQITLTGGDGAARTMPSCRSGSWRESAHRLRRKRKPSQVPSSNVRLPSSEEPSLDFAAWSPSKETG